MSVPEIHYLEAVANDLGFNDKNTADFETGLKDGRALSAIRTRIKVMRDELEKLRSERDRLRAAIDPIVRRSRTWLSNKSDLTTEELETLKNALRDPW